ncbi:secreted protein NIS1 [Ilyonectria robusta]
MRLHGQIHANSAGVDESNQLRNFNKTITIPKSTPKGKGVVSASLFTLIGAAESGVLNDYNVTVTFGDKTSKKYKSSS